MHPTARLSGLHFRAIVEQRIIANYPVPPAVVRPLIPSDARLWELDGRAWISACFVQMRHVRPTGFPRWAGVPLRYLVHRTMAEVPFPDGRLRKAVYVLEAYGDPPLQRAMARVLGGAPFRPSHIEWRRHGDGFYLSVSRDGAPIYQARSKPGFASSVFPDIAAADHAILGMAWGSSNDGRWSLFPETHEPWNAYSLVQTTEVNTFRDGLGLKGIEADNVVGMQDCPHSFGRPLHVRAALVEA